MTDEKNCKKMSFKYKFNFIKLWKVSLEDTFSM